MPRRARRAAAAAATALATSFAVSISAAPAASATPVCTDGYKGGPPATECGGRIFPEAALSQGYVQYNAQPATGFREYFDGVAYLAQKYPRWVSWRLLSADRGDPKAVSAGPDRQRSTDPADTGDGRQILIIKITDHEAPDAGKETLAFSLSVHGNERGGLEGGLRTAEDLATAATGTGSISDGVANYTSNTGRSPVFHSYPVKDVLAKEAVYLVDFNVDGWAVGDYYAVPTAPYSRGNSIGTDLNRQMPTVGRINTGRNPLTESETKYGLDFLRDVAGQGRGGLMAYGADVHGEITSNAYVDIMYPAGQFDSVKHRQLMAIAERTKSVIDATLYQGIQDQIENATGGNEGEGPDPTNTIPSKPAHWATVWDTLGYTETGFIGDYLATDLGVTGMDYEIFLNHTVPDKTWDVYLQENHINATRGIIKTAMAYALYQSQEFNDSNVAVDPGGRAGFVVNPDRVTDTDANGPGTLPGPNKDGKGQDGRPVQQASYSVSNQQWFADTSRLMGTKPFRGVTAYDVATNRPDFTSLDTLVLSDAALPRDAADRAVDPGAYYGNLKAWVQGGGNLVLTDRALHALEAMAIVPSGKVSDIKLYQPYSDITDFSAPLVRRLRQNARQLVEAAILGYGIGNTASPMTAVDQAAFTAAGGKVVGTTGTNLVSLGQLALGQGQVRVVGGALPTPTEDNDHRYGLRSYGLTYSGLYVMENAIRYSRGGDAEPVVPEAPLTVTLPLVALALAAGYAVRRRRATVQASAALQ